MVAISESDLMTELITEYARGKCQPGDVTVRGFYDALLASGMTATIWQARRMLDAKVESGELVKVWLNGKDSVYRKVTN